jgi:hypothetical protein
MARFHGEVGFGSQVELAAGVWDDVVIEKTYFGDIVRNHRKFNEGESVNDDLSLLSNSISIVSDTYANEHIFAIRYVKWAGSLWKVTDVDVGGCLQWEHA